MGKAEANRAFVAVQVTMKGAGGAAAGLISAKGLFAAREPKGLRHRSAAATFPTRAMSALSRHASSLQVHDWGPTRYLEALERQQQAVAQRMAEQIGDTLIFTEHDPVFTLGLRPGAESNLVWDEARARREGIAIVKTNRGGDVTYHGPGQIVGYPILSLAAHRDLHAYLRFLEEVLIETVAAFGLEAKRRDGKTGIWIGPRKIAAIGVAVRRWVTYHGFALNVNGSLAPYTGIIPCGIAAADGTVTSMTAELGREVEPSAIKPVLAEVFARQLTKFLAPPAMSPAARAETAG